MLNEKDFQILLLIIWYNDFRKEYMLERIKNYFT